MSDTITILNVDSHPLWSLGVASVINGQPDMRLVAQASTGREAIDYFRAHQTDIILTDIRLPDISGIEFMIAIRAEFPSARFIIVTGFAHDNEIRRALAHGARAYLLKSMPPAEFLEAIRQVHAGKKCIPPEIAGRLAEHLAEEPLSDREVEVLRLVMAGNRNQDVAHHLYISVETVKTHMKRIMEKLSASDRTHAITIAAQRGILQLWGTQ